MIGHETQVQTEIGRILELELSKKKPSTQFNIQEQENRRNDELK